jgi:hypothetical protein
MAGGRHYLFTSFQEGARNMNIKRILTAVVVGIAVVSACCVLHAKEESTQIKGKVEQTSLKVKSHQESMIRIHVSDRPNETFAISVKNIMRLPGFKDLKNPHPGIAYGDAAVWQTVDERLTGKEVVLECVRSVKSENYNTYVIRKITIH